MWFTTIPAGIDNVASMTQRKRSFIEGPNIPGQFDDPDAPGKWPGEKLGLPKEGPGALASVLRRCGGVLIDWLISLAIATMLTTLGPRVLGDTATLTLIIFAILGMLSVMIFARTPGQAVMKMGVARIDDRAAHVGVWRSIVRTLLTIAVLPAAMVDADGRGLHDRATGTAVVLG